MTFLADAFENAQAALTVATETQLQQGIEQAKQAAANETIFRFDGTDVRMVLQPMS